MLKLFFYQIFLLMFYPFCQSVKWRNFNQSVLHQDKNLSNDRKKKEKSFSTELVHTIFNIVLYQRIKWRKCSKLMKQKEENIM